MRKLITVLLILILLFLALATGYLYNENSKLKSVVDAQYDLINKSSNKNSHFTQQVKSYKDSIKTVTEQLSYVMNGKPISSKQLINLYVITANEKDSLEYLLKRERDKFDFAKRRYGFDVYDFTHGDTTTITAKFARADSAKLIFPFFRNRMTLNKKDSWNIDTFGDETDKKKLKTLNQKIKDLLKPDTSKANK